jgi:hypothetical protein
MNWSTVDGPDPDPAIYKSCIHHSSLRFTNEEAIIGAGLQGVSLSILLPIWYWVSDLDSSRLNMGVVRVCAFCSTLPI